MLGRLPSARLAARLLDRAGRADRRQRRELRDRRPAAGAAGQHQRAGERDTERPPYPVHARPPRTSSRPHRQHEPTPYRRRSIEFGCLADEIRSGGRRGEQVADQVVDQVVAVLGEDRLGVELDAAVVRPAHQVDVAGLRIGLDRDPVGRRRRTGPSDAARRRCCRSRPARCGRRSTTGDWVPWKTMSLNVSGRPSRWHSAWWPRQTARNGCSRSSSRSTAPRSVAIFGSSPSRGSPGPGPTIDQVVVVEVAVLVLVVADHLAGHAEHAEHVAQHVHEVVLAVEDHHPLAGQRRVRRRARPGRSARTCSAGGCGS